MQYIGIDGGGTKTKFTLFDEDMKEIDSYKMPSCHFAQVGYQRMEEMLKEGIHTLATRYHLKSYGIGFGLAGYGQEKEIRERMESIIERVSDGHPYLLINDVESALAGALALQDGIMIIAGTGSIAFGVHGKERFRCGGWGYQIGDEGSAWWLGKRALETFGKQADGRYDKSVFYEIMMKHANLSKDYDMISYVRDVCGNKRDKIAQMALLLYEAACQKDSYAISIYEEAASELSMLVETIRKRLFPNTDHVPVSYVGGVFQAGKYIIEPLTNKLSRHCELHEPIYGPDKGVCLLLKRKMEFEN